MIVKKKVSCAKERLKAQQKANFLGYHEHVFSYDFNVPSIPYLFDYKPSDFYTIKTEVN